MVIDAKTVPENQSIETDICIIGAGAAGIALAKALSTTKHRIAILESGSFDFNQDTQSLYQGKNVGIPYFPLHAARLRFFGGTTNHWGGYCDPFEDFDFVRREGIPHTGWPIQKSDIDPYYSEAADFCRITTKEWKNAYWEEQDKSPAFHFEDQRVDNKIIQITPSTSRHFGSIYREAVTAAENVTTYLNANVTGIVSNEAGRQVSHVEVATLEGNRFTVKSRQFILAAGGIENPRILLLSTKRHRNGLGNQNDLVGRFFMEHPRFTAGRFYPASNKIKLGFYSAHKVNNVQIKGHLVLARKVLEAEQLVDVQMKLTPAYDQKYVDALDAKSGNSLVYMMKSLSHGKAPDEFSKHLSRVVFDIENLPTFAYSKYFKDSLPVHHVELVTRLDAVPNPDSRVLLSASERDQLGQPRVELDWRLSDLDRRSAVRAAEIMAEEFGQNGLGRLQMNISESDREWPADTAGGFHHMGTTRMSDDPKQGVVDKDCKVHGIANLYVAGSSVFTTAGSGSPTLTIVALALRLADHLKKGMASS
ncbi:MAG: GMC family oxidoreductase [Calditrichaeota bacterium]|nr:GMC family oxidoreductase [Calditrichota bacterium]MCB0303382.1 GMC family oxidoreductase [Calditrichota bacterium]MCB9088788.1 GMC family oxidoreductase [Calditrichia bacterium]